MVVFFFFFFSSRRRHTRSLRDWSSDVCSSDLCCDANTARQIATCMLRDETSSEEHAADALGEICNMITGNFKNKLAGTDEQCMLSVPSVISGGKHTFRSLADGNSIETALLFEGEPVFVRLQ